MFASSILRRGISRPIWTCCLVWRRLTNPKRSDTSGVHFDLFIKTVGSKNHEQSAQQNHWTERARQEGWDCRKVALSHGLTPFAVPEFSPAGNVTTRTRLLQGNGAVESQFYVAAAMRTRLVTGSWTVLGKCRACLLIVNLYSSVRLKMRTKCQSRARPNVVCLNTHCSPRV